MAAIEAQARRERRKSRARRLSGIDAGAAPPPSRRGASVRASDDEVRGAAMLAEWNRAAGAGETVSAAHPPFMPDVVLIELAERFGTPLYVYNFDAVAQQVRYLYSQPVSSAAPLFPPARFHLTVSRLAHHPSCHALQHVQIHSLRRAFARAGTPLSLRYAVKANSCAALLKFLLSMGVGVDCVSPAEVRGVADAGPACSCSQLLSAPCSRAALRSTFLRRPARLRKIHSRAHVL